MSTARRAVMVLIALASVVAVGLLTGCSSTTADPTSAGIAAAIDFLETTSDEDAMEGDKALTRGIVMTIETGDGSWSMELLRTDGATVTIDASFFADNDDLDNLVSPGDYVAVDEGSDNTIGEGQLRILKPQAVDLFRTDAPTN